MLRYIFFKKTAEAGRGKGEREVVMGMGGEGNDRKAGWRILLLDKIQVEEGINPKLKIKGR